MRAPPSEMFEPATCVEDKHGSADRRRRVATIALVQAGALTRAGFTHDAGAEPPKLDGSLLRVAD